MSRRRRSTGDTLILLIAGTICFAVLAAGAVITVVRLTNPEADVSNVASFITDTINTLLGLMAGFLAGRTESERRREDDDD